MVYQFDTDIAKEYGLDEAVMIYNFQYWIAKNEANRKHFYAGRYWTYNSADAFSKLFPFWSAYQVRRILKSLQEKDVLITGNFNPSAYDRTMWYAFSDSFISKFQNRNFHLAISQNGDSENARPIPNNKEQIIIANNNSNIESNEIFPSEEIEIKEKKSKGTRERSCLFSNSKFADFDKFRSEIEKAEKYAGADIEYYYECVKNWSDAKGVKREDWIATAKNWMLRDFNEGKLRKERSAGGLTQDDIDYLKLMQ